LIDLNDNLRSELDALKQMDVVLSIDDFGSGFSNFVYLTDLELIGQIKIDQSIIREIDSNPSKLKRLRAIINMLKDIGYQVVVEGVENKEQLDLLSGAGHDCLQGFYLSRPLHPEQAENLIMTLANQLPINGKS
jgi:two-component system CheB/CheR fusion protein